MIAVTPNDHLKACARTPNVFFSTHVAQEQQVATRQAFRFIASQHEISLEKRGMFLIFNRLCVASQ